MLRNSRGAADQIFVCRLAARGRKAPREGSVFGCLPLAVKSLQERLFLPPGGWPGLPFPRKAGDQASKAPPMDFILLRLLPGAGRFRLLGDAQGEDRFHLVTARYRKELFDIRTRVRLEQGFS